MNKKAIRSLNRLIGLCLDKGLTRASGSGRAASVLEDLYEVTQEQLPFCPSCALMQSFLIPLSSTRGSPSESARAILGHS